MKRRRTEITIETDRTFYISSPRIVVSWCLGCSAQVNMITVDQAAVLCGVNSRTIFQWAEAGSIHVVETAEGRLFICPNSIT